MRAASLIVPGMSRLLVAVAVAVAVAAPMLADATTLALLAWHALAAACLATSWLFARTSRLFVRDVEDACTAIRLVTVAQRD